MRQFITSIRRFLVSEDGPTTVEYAVMAGFIITVCVVGITAVGQATLGLYTTSTDQMP